MYFCFGNSEGLRLIRKGVSDLGNMLYNIFLGVQKNVISIELIKRPNCVREVGWRRTSQIFSRFIIPLYRHHVTWKGLENSGESGQE